MAVSSSDRFRSFPVAAPAADWDLRRSRDITVGVSANVPRRVGVRKINSVAVHILEGLLRLEVSRRLRCSKCVVSTQAPKLCAAQSGLKKLAARGLASVS